MAEAKRTTVEKLVTETKKVPAITLTLTPEEAEALHALVGNITGDSTGSPRKHTDGIYYALQRAGIDTIGKPILKQMSGSLRWLNEPKSSYPSYRF
ncbi:hypothetical protein [Streptomyces afghaniensis]|uniref:hypothetical protein n=1 Tax=Streptomyces afghaniensis TaxID=66865 RepID=UPI002784D362|nr:hypothetical protein [Streptomyces afghaniensis]MDQ1016678.1 hypothetical protein [Streptomyces afghaniensis]